MIGRVPHLLKNLLGRHLVTVLVLATFLLVGFLVAQIRELIRDVFAVGSVVPWMTLTLVVWGIGLICRFLLVSPDGRVVNRQVHRLPPRVRRWFRYPMQFLIVAPTQTLYGVAHAGRRFSGTSYAVLVNLAIASVGLWLATQCPLSPSLLSSLNSLWPLPGGFLRMMGLLVAMMALWLGAGTWVGPNQVLDAPDRDAPDQTDATDNHPKTTERWVRVWRRTGEVLSVLLVLTLMLELVWVAAESTEAIDMTVYTVWAFFTLAFGGTVLAALLDYLHRNTLWPWRLIAGGVLIGLASLPSPVDLQETEAQDVAEQLKIDEPVDWIDAGLDRLRHQPEGPIIIVTASGGGSRAALVAALSLEVIEDEFRQDGPHPACMWLGSGVSGGGLALASHYYPSTWQSSSRDAVTRDYLGPLFRGFLTPFSNRGESLTAYWDRAFPWSVVDQTTRDPTKPLLVFGVADIDTGRRLIIGYPRLPRDWFSRWTNKATPDPQRWILSDKDHAPYSLSSLRQDDMLPKVRLTRAVRMSSSFPFGFEPTRMVADVPGSSSRASSRIHFLDGGMVDNTGVDSVLAIVSRINDSETPRCKQLSAQLRSRGIYLIEIDAGAGSGEVADSGIFSRVKQPFGGYNRGVYAAAKRARDRNVAELQALFKQNFTTEPIESHPKNEDVSEIMTTFALPKRDVRRLTSSFENPQRQAIIREVLRKRYKELQQ